MAGSVRTWSDTKLEPQAEQPAGDEQDDREDEPAS